MDINLHDYDQYQPKIEVDWILYSRKGVKSIIVAQV